MPRGKTVLIVTAWKVLNKLLKYLQNSVTEIFSHDSVFFSTEKKKLYLSQALVSLLDKKEMLSHFKH